jgi:hypothetical protein
MTTTRRLAAVGIAFLAASLGAPAARADDKEVCASSYENAQKLRRDGKLKDARQELVTCGSAKCPAVLIPFCVQWLREIDASLPTVVIVARGPNGEETEAVKVLIDGTVAAPRLDGRPIAVDPGKHHLRYELEGSAPIDEDVIVHAGEQNRRLAPAFHALGAAPPPLAPKGEGAAVVPPVDTTAPPAPTRWPIVAAFGLGAAGVGIGAVTGALAIGAKSTLDGECATKSSCPAAAQADIDRLHTMSTISTIGFIGAGVGIGAGVLLLVMRPASRPAPAPAAARVEPWIGPLSAGLRGSF